MPEVPSQLAAGIAPGLTSFQAELTPGAHLRLAPLTWAPRPPDFSSEASIRVSCRCLYDASSSSSFMQSLGKRPGEGPVRGVSRMGTRTP